MCTAPDGFHDIATRAKKIIFHLKETKVLESIRESYEDCPIYVGEQEGKEQVYMDTLTECMFGKSRRPDT